MNTSNTNTAANSTSGQPTPGHGSLLNDPAFLAAPSLNYRRPAGESLKVGLDRLTRWSNSRTGKRLITGLVCVAMLTGAAAAYAAFWPRSVPDYLQGELDDVLDYTLLTEDFNRLPIDQRLALIKQLVQRLKGMDAGDSELMAAFAAGITGKARAQLQRNVEKMAVDVWDSYAQKYDDIPKDQRDEYLDNAFLEFSKMMEDVSGFKSDKPDNKRITEAKGQAAKDQERMKQNQGPVDGRGVGRLMKAVNDRGDSLAEPKQKARMARFSRDMVRHMRNEDLDTGKPKDEGGE